MHSNSSSVICTYLQGLTQLHSEILCQSVYRHMDYKVLRMHMHLLYLIWSEGLLCVCVLQEPEKYDKNEHSTHIINTYTHHKYRIAGKFREVKYSRFSRLR